MSAEVESDVSQAYMELSNRIEASLNNGLLARGYGAGLVEWSFIGIILNDDTSRYYKEINRYNKKDKTCEFRLKIDYKQFKEGDMKKRTKMLCESLLRSLSLLESKNVPNLDLAALRQDFIDIALRQEWL